MPSNEMPKVAGWAPEPELQAELPRRVRLRVPNGHDINNTLFVLAFMVALTLVLLNAMRNGVTFVRLGLEGQSVPGRIQSKRFEGSAKRRHFLRYAYRFEGATRRAEERVSRDNWEAARRPAIRVRVLPQSPDHALLESPSRFHVGWVLAVGALVAAGGVALLAWWGGGLLCLVARVRGERDLVARGRVAVAAITDCYAWPTEKPNQRLIHFAFGAVDEQGYREKVAASTTLPLNGDGPRRGNKVTVLYDPSQPSLNVLYPLGMWKARR